MTAAGFKLPVSGVAGTLTRIFYVLGVEFLLDIVLMNMKKISSFLIFFILGSFCMVLKAPSGVGVPFFSVNSHLSTVNFFQTTINFLI